ncbi:MAG: PAS domain S-box protein, partial [Deltaproteobacteria bacterium]
LKEYMESILEHANALIMVTDTNRQVLVYNETAARVLGFGKQEVLGQDLIRLVPPEDRDLLTTEISRLIEGKPSEAGMEIHLRNREGQLVQIVFHLALLKDHRGDADSIILVGQDLTPLRRLERQIIEAEKMASLGKLAAGIVHELNNPLTSISVYAEYVLKKLESGSLDSKDIEKVRKILEGANRIQKLTRDLVSYSRPAEEEPELTDLNEVVRQGISFCEHTIRKYDIVTNLELASDLPPLLAIRNQLLQVVINLVTNSCQAMEGGGELTVSTERRNDHVLLQVADTGVGIPDSHLNKLFEPFFTTKKSGQGTGLGLSIVARIVEHHRGRIEVESSSGEGTAFSIMLPLGGPGNHEKKYA